MAARLWITTSVDQLTKQEVKSKQRRITPKPCSLRKASIASPLFGLLVGGWEQVEGVDSSSVSAPGRRDICEGSSHPEDGASIAVWPRFGTEHEATRVGG
ncbi:hypothetical protein JZ751_015142 [Albula glossodonta]|uniref:Uncharacterized protein n=1 Tax=Albula glossodonta TaxID=121402 RepID=A0A8T2NTS2_9TELE|nr:hypothetical protein JZ751_015142 [Albula glossodonta]